MLSRKKNSPIRPPSRLMSTHNVTFSGWSRLCSSPSIKLEPMVSRGVQVNEPPEPKVPCDSEPETVDSRLLCKPMSHIPHVFPWSLMSNPDEFVYFMDGGECLRMTMLIEVHFSPKLSAQCPADLSGLSKIDWSTCPGQTGRGLPLVCCLRNNALSWNLLSYLVMVKFWYHRHFCDPSPFFDEQLVGLIKRFFLKM